MPKVAYLMFAFALAACVGRVHVPEEHAAQAPIKALEACQSYGWTNAVPSRSCSTGTCLEFDCE